MPLLFNRKVTGLEGRALRNFDILDVALNHLVAVRSREASQVAMNDRRAQAQGVIEVHNPFTRELVGTVPKATVADVRRAFEIARAFRPAFTRHQRAQLLEKSASLLRARVEEASDLITRESGLCKKDSLYEVGRVCDVLVFSAIEALKDDGQAFSCDLTPHGKNRRVFTRREPLLGVISRDHAVQPPDEPGRAQGRARRSPPTTAWC